MANLPETPVWETGIYQLEETDPVQGGANGIDNQQGKQLANRTAWLKQQVETLGNGKQPLDATLTALASLATVADCLIYSTGPDAFAVTPLSAFIRTLLDDSNASSARATIGAISQAQLDVAIADLVNSSPATLNTLNELASALGNDANFATTVSNALALKASIQSVQKSESIVSVAGGGADAITATYTPAIAALSNGMTLYVRAASTNATTTPTFTPASGTIAAKTIVKGAGGALAAGDIAGGGHWIELQYDATLDKWVLLNPATGVSVVPGVVGTARNAKMSVTAASATATFTADEVVVSSALGGAAYKIGAFNKTINLATTGAGGMDTGSAPVSGYVALYAIYNPTSGASALLAVNATASAAPNVYGGANMPAGYTASGLISVWPTNASSQFKIGYQVDRTVSFPLTNALSTGTSAGSYTALSISGLVPANAKTVGGTLQAANTLSTSQQTNMYVAADTSGTGAAACIFAGGTAGGGAVMCPFSNLPIITGQTIYYIATTNAGTPSYIVQINGYSF